MALRLADEAAVVNGGLSRVACRERLLGFMSLEVPLEEESRRRRSAISRRRLPVVDIHAGVKGQVTALLADERLDDDVDDADTPTIQRVREATATLSAEAVERIRRGHAGNLRLERGLLHDDEGRVFVPAVGTLRTE